MTVMKNVFSLTALIWKKQPNLFLCYALQIVIDVIQNVTGVLFVNILLGILGAYEMKKAVIWAAVICVSTFFLSSIAVVLSAWKKRLTEKFNICIKGELLRIATSIPYADYEEQSFRETYQFATKCVRSDYIGTVINSIVVCVSSVASVFALTSIMGYIVWWMWILIALSVVIRIFCELYRMHYNFENQKNQNSVEMKMLYSRDRLTWKAFAKEVRLYQMFDYVSKQAARYIDELSLLQSSAANRNINALWWVHIFNGVQTISVYAFVAYLCLTDKISVLEFSTISLAILSVSQLAAEFVDAVVSVKENYLYIDHLVSFLNVNCDSDEEFESIPCFDEIKFTGVCFGYKGSKTDAVKDFDYTFAKGKKYGIVGANGSGKTTLVNLLMGLYQPSKGKILLDGRDISKLSAKAYMGMFAPVFQDFNVYAYSVGENISLSDKIDENRFEFAIKNFGVGHGDTKIRNNLNTFVSKEYSDDGVEFSGGEEQRIAIARALYKDSPVMILDEPSSSLSPQREAELYEMVRSSISDKTIIFISHRLASCILCDEILVFDKGRLVECGSHDKLMEKRGLYFTMFTTQKSLYTTEGVI